MKEKTTKRNRHYQNRAYPIRDNILAKKKKDDVEAKPKDCAPPVAGPAHHRVDQLPSPVKKAKNTNNKRKQKQKQKTRRGDITTTIAAHPYYNNKNNHKKNQILRHHSTTTTTTTTITYTVDNSPMVITHHPSSSSVPNLNNNNNQHGGTTAPTVSTPPSSHTTAATPQSLTGKALLQHITSNEKYELRVGQFNVLNLVKENEPYYGQKYSAKKVDAKVDWISGQLKRMNCGIVAFEEVWHRDTLLRCTRASGLYKDSQVFTIGANGSGPTVALASIFPVVETEAIVDFPNSSILEYDGTPLPITRFNRPILRAVVELPFGRTVTVFVVHAKSKRPLVEDHLRHDQKAKAVGHSLSLIVRAAEATALRHILVNEIKKTHNPIILMGDLNDNVHSVTTQIITGTEPWKNMSRSDKEKIWETLLWSTNQVQVRTTDRDVTYTHIHNGRYEVLDHILVSQHFVRTNPHHIGYIQYQQILNDHLIDETLKDEKRSNIESDHGQVVAVIKLLSDSHLKKRIHRHYVEEVV